MQNVGLTPAPLILLPHQLHKHMHLTRAEARPESPRPCGLLRKSSTRDLSETQRRTSWRAGIRSDVAQRGIPAGRMMVSRNVREVLIPRVRGVGGRRTGLAQRQQDE